MAQTTATVRVVKREEDEFWATEDTRKALREGYKETARLAEIAMKQAEEDGDKREAKEQEKLMKWALSKAKLQYPENDVEPNHLSFYAFDERIGLTGCEYADELDVPHKYDHEFWSHQGKYAIAGAMALLTDKEAEMFQLYMVDGVSRKEAAELMQMPQSTFDVHVKNVYKKLKKYVERLDSISEKCDPTAQNVLVALRGEKAKDMEALRTQHETVAREVFRFACEHDLLTEQERMTYERCILLGEEAEGVCGDFDMTPDEVSTLVKATAAKIRGLTDKVEIKVTLKP